MAPDIEVNDTSGVHGILLPHTKHWVAFVGRKLRLSLWRSCECETPLVVGQKKPQSGWFSSKLYNICFGTAAGPDWGLAVWPVTCILAATLQGAACLNWTAESWIRWSTAWVNVERSADQTDSPLGTERKCAGGQKKKRIRQKVSSL